MRGRRDEANRGRRPAAAAMAAVTALLVLTGAPPSSAQGPPPTTKDDGGTARKDARATDLATRFRFIQRFTPADQDPDEAPRGVAYRIQARETFLHGEETAQRGMSRSQGTRRVEYTEIPATCEGPGRVTSAVRRYDLVRTGEAEPRADGRPGAGDAAPLDPLPDLRSLEGTTIWFRHQQLGHPTQMAVLGRPANVADPTLTQEEFDYIASPNRIFVPSLALLLPTLATGTRVGDQWRVSFEGARALVGEGGVRRGVLTGRFVGLNFKDNQGIAQIDVVGRITKGDGSDASLNARIFFVFPEPRANPTEAPASGEGDAPAAPPGGKVVEASGTIVRLLMTQVNSGPLGEAGGKTLRWFDRQELILNLSPATDAKLDVPETAPTLTPENSWVRFDDPQGRFRVRHPQELIPARRSPPGAVAFFHSEPGGSVDRFLMELVPGPLRPDAVRDEWVAKWKKPANRGGPLPEVTPAELQDLSGPDWPADWKVSEFDAVVILPGLPEAQRRLSCYNFVIQFPQNANLRVEAMTSKDPPGPFRTELEQILKTFQLLALPKRPGAREPGQTPSPASAPRGVMSRPAPRPQPPTRPAPR